MGAEGQAKDPGSFFTFIWSVVGLELLVVPVLFATGAFDGGGKETALVVVILTLLAAAYSLRGTDWSQEQPIVWIGFLGVFAQLIASPFLSAVFDDVEFPESVVPELHEPLAAWVVILGAFGALAVGAATIRFKDRVQNRLQDVPASYQRFVERTGTAAGRMGSNRVRANNHVHYSATSTDLERASMGHFASRFGLASLLLR